VKRREHYQERRAHADGWEVWELFGNKKFIVSSFTPDGVYEIEPDKDGWLPWYPTEGSACPVDGDQMVEVDHFEDKEVRRFKGKAGDTRWEKTSQFNITRYRLVEEEIIKPCSICGKGPYDSEDVYVGTGDGTGNSFAHKSCYDKREAEQVDPYAELKAAYEAGETIQVMCSYGWEAAKTPSWSYPVEEYRVKPTTVKMWQWVVGTGGHTMLTNGFFPTVEEMEREYRLHKVIQRADWTEIEVPE
jgi:hypothetical protein